MMKNNPQYVFIDSGLGGLAYLKLLKIYEPKASVTYIADNANFPYGTKTEAEITELAVNLVGKTIDCFSPEAIILACNTISVTALSKLRNKFTTKFVGTVPAIKLASEKTVNGKIGIIASEKTINDKYTKNLIQQFGNNFSFSLLADQELIQNIENGLMFKSNSEKIQAIKYAMDFFSKEQVDCLVLACTHFLLINDVFKNVAKPEIQIIESLEGVIRQTLKISPPIIGKEENSFFITKSASSADIKKYMQFAKSFDLDWKGVL